MFGRSFDRLNCCVYVNLAQRLLGVTPDGKFGTGTLAAVKQFQSNKGLAIDGIVGPKTWNELAKLFIPAKG